MSDTVDDWRALIGEVQKTQRKINATNGQIRSAALREEVRGLAQTFFQQLRLGLIGAGLDEEVQALTDLFENLIRLSEAASTKPKYQKAFKTIRDISPDVVTRLEKDRGKSLRPELTITAEDEKIIETLKGLVPAAALSYQQAIADLADDNRVSFRRAGPRTEGSSPRNAGLPRPRQGRYGSPRLQARAGAERTNDETEGPLHPHRSSSQQIIRCRPRANSYDCR